MNTALYGDIAKQIRQSLSVRDYTFNIENKYLFITLYSAFCRHNPNSHMPGVDTIVNKDHFDDAVDEMYRWYYRAYAKTFGLTFGHKGQHRTVTDSNIYKDGKYNFAVVYHETSFKDNLTNPPKQAKNFRNFILHMAVAFLITPVELDELLNNYALRRLHAKNIHDLSIYAALSLLSYGAPDPDVNPFYEVYQLYEEARAIVKDVRKCPNSEKTAAALPTAFIRDSLMGNAILTHERFIQFVNDHKEAFNMRHSMLLQEYRKLSELFRYIYDNRHFKGAEDCWDVETNAYSWRSFLESFCIKSTDPTRCFREQFGIIDKNGKHPTRETMIVLWIYAYTFISVHGVGLTEKMFDRISESLKERQTETGDTGPCWMTEAKGCFYKYDRIDQITFVFNIRKFIFHNSEPPKNYFSGSELKTWLNEKLQQFDLGSLNASLKFDAVILQLCKVEISLDEQDRADYLKQNAYNLKYSGVDIKTKKIDGVNNVPYALVAIVEILKKLKESFGNFLPLECQIYE